MPKVKNQLTEETPVVINQVYASFWQRLAALLIDAVIMAMAGFMLALILKTIDQRVTFIEEFLQFMIGVSYYVFYQAHEGQTIGKKILKIKVVNELNQTPMVFTFFLREVVGKTISGLTLGVGYLWMLWDGKKQTLHDKIANTYVVKV